jgi:WD40 repeat protein
LFSGSRDGTVKVWDTESGRCLLTLAAGGREVLSLALSPDDRRLVSGNADGTLTVWDAPRHQ